MKTYMWLCIIFVVVSVLSLIVGEWIRAFLEALLALTFYERRITEGRIAKLQQQLKDRG